MNKIESAVAIVKNKIDFAEKMLDPMKDFNGGKDFTDFDFHYVAWHDDGPYAQYSCLCPSERRHYRVPGLNTLVNYGILVRKKIALSFTTPTIYCCYHFEDGTSYSVPQPLSGVDLATHIHDHGSLMNMDVRASVDNIRETCYRYVYNFAPEFAANPKKFMRDNMTRLVMNALESVIDD